MENMYVAYIFQAVASTGVAVLFIAALSWIVDKCSDAYVKFMFDRNDQFSVDLLQAAGGDAFRAVAIAKDVVYRRFLFTIIGAFVFDMFMTVLEKM